MFKLPAIPGKAITDRMMASALNRVKDEQLSFMKGRKMNEDVNGNRKLF